MDLGTIFARLQEGMRNSSANLQGAIQGDLTNPEEMMKVQFQLMMYGQAVQLQAGISKKFDDLITGIIAKL